MRPYRRTFKPFTYCRVGNNNGVREFMVTGLLKTLGHLFCLLKGAYTVKRLPVIKDKTHTVCSDKLLDGYQVQINSECIRYETIYKRWWVPNNTTTLYYVSAMLTKTACADTLIKRLEPLVVRIPLISRVCPCCDKHYYAINVYIDTVMSNLQKMSTIVA